MFLLVKVFPRCLQHGNRYFLTARRKETKFMLLHRSAPPTAWGGATLSNRLAASRDCRHSRETPVVYRSLAACSWMPISFGLWGLLVFWFLVSVAASLPDFASCLSSLSLPRMSLKPGTSEYVWPLAPRQFCPLLRAACLRPKPVSRTPGALAVRRFQEPRFFSASDLKQQKRVTILKQDKAR